MAEPNQISNPAAGTMPVAPAAPAPAAATAGPAATQSAPVSGQTTSPMVNASTAGPATVSGGSPWDEELPQLEAEKQQAAPVIGSLEPNQNQQAESAPFNVPENIEEKVGQKVSAEQYITPQNTVPGIFEPDDDAPNATQTSQPAPVQSSGMPVEAQAPVQEAPKEGFLKSLFAKKPKAVESTVPVPAPIPAPTPVTPNLAAVNPEKRSRFAFFQNPKLIAVLGVIAFLVFIVSLTELGLISIGAEKVYGAIGIERFWGGLPANPENAVIKSALVMQKHPNFKAKGDITLSVDTSVNSPITSPLFSYAKQTALAMRDVNASVSSIPAIKTATDDSSDIYDLYDIGSSGSSSSSSSSTSSSSSSTASTNTNSTSGESLNTTDGTATVDANQNDNTNSTLMGDSSSSNSNSDSSSQGETSNISDIKSTISLKTSTEGASADITPSDSSQNSAINLMLKNGDLLVKSNTIKFASNATANKWLDYKIDKLKGKTIQKDIFAVGSDSGFSVKGKRDANEKVGKVRCYRYKIDSLEIGNALASIGITSDMIQNISGNIWVGISDKTIHKVNLKIVTPISSSVTVINVNLEFSDYDIANKLSFPDESEIIEPVAGASVATPTDRDAKRKADIDTMLNALKSYKAANGSYPISNTLLKLSDSGNMIEQALVPKYISALPTDPSAGWYYAYKSNEGKNCSISARLENTVDPSGVTIGGIFLYLKYNDN